MKVLPSSGPSASSPAATNSQIRPCTRCERSGAAARMSNAAASPMVRRRSVGAFGKPVAATDSTGIEARLELLVAPLARIPAVVREQGGVITLLGDVPALQHDGVVGVGHGAQPVADDDDGAPYARFT